MTLLDTTTAFSTQLRAGTQPRRAPVSRQPAQRPNSSMRPCNNPEQQAAPALRCLAALQRRLATPERQSSHHQHLCHESHTPNHSQKQGFHLGDLAPEYEPKYNHLTPVGSCIYLKIS